MRDAAGIDTDEGRARKARALLAVAALGLLCLAAGARAEPYTVGSRLEPFELDDQHGATHRVGAGVRAIVFGSDMDAGGVIREAIGEQGELLDDAGAVYVADVSGMPGIIRRLIAEPRMRDRPYPMLLDRDGTHTERLPAVGGRATLIVLDGLEITRIAHHESADTLRAALEALAPVPAAEGEAGDGGEPAGEAPGRTSAPRVDSPDSGARPSPAPDPAPGAADPGTDEE